MGRGVDECVSEREREREREIASDIGNLRYKPPTRARVECSISSSPLISFRIISGITTLSLRLYVCQSEREGEKKAAISAWRMMMMLIGESRRDNDRSYCL